MSSRVFKNNQVTYGIPFQVRIPLTMRNIKTLEEYENDLEFSDDISEVQDDPEQVLIKAREEADAIIKEAEKKSINLIDNKIKEAEIQTKQIAEEAWQRGYAEGLEAAKAQYEDLINEAEAIKASSMEEHDSVLAGMEAEIINMVIDISKKVIGHELEVNKENMLYLVKQALEKCSNKNNIVLKVCNNDYEYLTENKDKLLEKIEGAGEIDFKVDLSLKEGSCIIETPFGNIDAGAQTKLCNIEEAFREVLEGK